jgi:ATP-binding cassette subfamily B protein
VADKGAPGWVRRMWGYLMRHRLDVTLSLLAAVAGSACQTVVPLVARKIVDGVIVRQDSPLWPWLVTLLAVAALAFAMAYVRRYRGGRVALAVQFDLRNDIHDHLQVMDLANLDRMSTGQLVGRANSDSTLVQGVLGSFPVMSGNMLLVLMSLVVMVVISPLLAAVSLIMLPLLFLVSYRMRWRVFPASWEAQQRAGEVAQIVDENVSGVRVVKAFGQEQREIARVVDASTSLYGARMRAVRLQSRYMPLLQTLPTLAQVAMLAFGGWLTMHGTISLGTFLAFSTYVGQFVAPARQLAGIVLTAQQARGGVERIFQLLDLPPAIADRAGATELPELRGSITFEDVWFGYAADRPVLRGLDLAVAAGERVAVVGLSGSGKSTLTSLVSRTYDPDRGRVLVDGVDVRDATLHSLRRQVGIAFDESFLFSDSVRSNIAYARPGAGREAIEAAAKVAQAHGFIHTLPAGYETTVGERGLSLSGGQRQRIALARAVLADPRILILDDATSAVDAQTEEAIHDALRETMEGRTTILIAHRVSTLGLADRIVVLEDGVIAAEGTHEELVSSSARYRSLFAPETQAAYGEDRIENLAATALEGRSTTAWTRADEVAVRAPGSTGMNAAATLGKGLGGGAAKGWKLNLAPTPELLARVAALPPIVDEPNVDLAREGQRMRRFSLWKILSEFRRPLLLGLVLVVLDSAAGLVGPVLVKIGLDDGVAQGSTATLFVASGVYLVVALADLLVQIAETFVTGRAAERIMLSLRIRIWTQLQRLSLDYYEREMSGRIMTRMTTDIDQFETLIQNGLLSALVSLVTFLGVGVVLLAVDLELGLLTLTVAAPLAIATTAFRRRSAVLYDESRERIAIVNADFQESLSGVRESQAFVHESATVARFHALGDRYLASRIAAQRLVAVYFPFVQFLAAVADAIALGFGAGLVQRGALTAGSLIAFILYIDLFFSPIQQLSQVFDAWQQTRVSSGRIAELMALEPLTPLAADPLVPDSLRGEIDLRSVRFSYPTAPARPADATRGPQDAQRAVVEYASAKPPEAITGLDLHIEPGETVALVGETGAGKSTVIKLIARFYDPDGGRVCADGHDLKDLDLLAYRHRLGYVPQEAFLFGGSVRDNIGYGRASATDAEIEAAARAVGAHELIASLSGGYLHELAERGKSLSSGQRQLIALARAELVDPAILLLDEATANLDLATEARVATAMRRLTSARTTIVIAHRLQTARSADRIVMLGLGRVLESGSHDELLQADGPYAAMWRAFESVGTSSASAASGIARAVDPAH